MRIGTGYDIHRLDTGRTFVLGGVVIPHTTGFVGHSDGDVLAHAVIDALLGAAGLGDIGSHFPPHDEAFRGADSMELLRRAVQLAAASLASALGVGVETVNIKAKTNEGLDAVGEGRAVAVHALVTLH
ncbi:MAG: 2-C-methyl-D-erythritol 2,4-cyclodiphosphate synthase [Chloroflexi bacterium]|nr:2-C-methyl-D-erythritol 2,4-cyclodiphosphate synthase [Chloroflexota bacterium]